MPRRKRCAVPGIPQLVSLYGHNQQRVFNGPVDYRDYLAFMLDACTETRVRLHAYTLLPNRVLVLCTPIRKDGVSLFMQAVGRRYTLTFNARYERSGALWNGRFKASHIDPDNYLDFAIRFVATNAPRQGLSPTAADYRWCGYPGGRTERSNGDLSRATAGAGHELLPDDMYETFENALRHELAIGCESFKAQLAREHGVRVCLGRPGRPRKQRGAQVRRFDLPAMVGTSLFGASA